MRIPFDGEFPTNQAYNDPCCRASYAKFGMNGHNGIDFGLPSGTPVLAAIDGTVYVGFEAGGYGNYVFITGEYQTVYGHLQVVGVSTGQRVTVGQQIGRSGNTGNSSGPHLHFGVRPINYDRNNGFLGYIDPQPLFNGGQYMTHTLTKEEVQEIHQLAFQGEYPGDSVVQAWTGKELGEFLRFLHQSGSWNDRVTQIKAALANSSSDANAKKIEQIKQVINS